MTIALTLPREGESFTAAGCTFRILDDGGPTAGRIGLAECDLVPGWYGPPQHIHREHDETFYVLTGTVKFTSGTDIMTAPAGSLVTAPIGAPHTFANPDPQAPASLLCILTPERYIGYFRELAMLEPGPDGMLAPEK